MSQLCKTATWARIYAKIGVRNNGGWIAPAGVLRPTLTSCILFCTAPPGIPQLFRDYWCTWRGFALPAA